MVSTRHHPREFPEPELPPSLSPTKSTTASPTKRSTSSANGSATRSPSKRSTSTTTSPTGTTTSKSASSSDGTMTTTTTTTTTRIPFASPIPSRSGLHTAPPLLILWLLISIPLVIWDAAYVLLRPHSMPGGKLHAPIWTPYALYGTVDHGYGWPAWDEGSGFTAAQSGLNVIETVGYIWYLYKLLSGLVVGEGNGNKITALVTGRNQGSRNCAEAVTVGFSISIMTLSKTVLYFLNDALSNPPFKHTSHNDFYTLFWLFLVPNAMWIFLPAYMSWVFGREIVGGLKAIRKTE